MLSKKFIHSFIHNDQINGLMVDNLDLVRGAWNFNIFMNDTFSYYFDGEIKDSLRDLNNLLCVGWMAIT